MGTSAQMVLFWFFFKKKKENKNQNTGEKMDRELSLGQCLLADGIWS